MKTFDYRLITWGSLGVLGVYVVFPPVIELAKTAQIGTTDKITALRRAVVGQESGGNFKAVNPDSGALGYGQLMPFNVKSWTTEALGKPLTPQKFLNNPDAQIKTIDHKLTLYFAEGLQKTDSESEAVRFAASKWYSGRGDLRNSKRSQFYNGRQYPSIYDYTRSVERKFHKELRRNND